MCECGVGGERTANEGRLVEGYVGQRSETAKATSRTTNADEWEREPGTTAEAAAKQRPQPAATTSESEPREDFGTCSVAQLTKGITKGEIRYIGTIEINRGREECLNTVSTPSSQRKEHPQARRITRGVPNKNETK